MNQTVTVFFTTDECLESTEGVTVAVKSSDTSVMVVTSPYSVYIIDSDSKFGLPLLFFPLSSCFLFTVVLL